MSAHWKFRLVLIAAAAGMLHPADRFASAADQEPATRRPAAPAASDAPATAPAQPAGRVRRPATTPNNGTPATTRGNPRPTNPMAMNAPTVFGQVTAYEAGKSLTIEVKRR